MNYDVIAIVYVILSVLFICMLYTKDKFIFDCTNLNGDKDACTENNNCKFSDNDQQCKNKIEKNAKYFLLIFLLIIVYLFINKIDLKYLISDYRFQKLILIITYFFIMSIIYITIITDKNNTDLLIKLILFGCCPIILIFTLISQNNLNQKLIKVFSGSILLIVMYFFINILYNIFIDKKQDNCINDLKIINNDSDIDSKFKEQIEKCNIEIDKCYSLEELQDLYKKSTNQECSFCVDYNKTTKEFECKTHQYCNENIKKKYIPKCINDSDKIIDRIQQDVDKENDDLNINECEVLLDKENKNQCFSLGELQKCYRKKYIKTFDKNDCNLCLDYKDESSIDNSDLVCKDKRYCDENLNRKYQLEVKNNDFSNTFKWISITTILVLFFLNTFLKNYRFNNRFWRFFELYVFGNNFKNVIKFAIIITILMIFMKILYNSLTTNIKTAETDQLLYDKYPQEFREVDEDSCRVHDGNEKKCDKNEDCKYVNDKCKVKCQGKNFENCTETDYCEYVNSTCTDKITCNEITDEDKCNNTIQCKYYGDDYKCQRKCNERSFNDDKYGKVGGVKCTNDNSPCIWDTQRCHEPCTTGRPFKKDCTSPCVWDNSRCNNPSS